MSYRVHLRQLQLRQALGVVGQLQQLERLLLVIVVLHIVVDSRTMRRRGGEGRATHSR